MTQSHCVSSMRVADMPVSLCL